MKNTLTHTLSTFAACAVLAALASAGPARGQRTSERAQRPVELQQTEPVERLPAPAERAEQLEVQELSEKELAARPDLFKLPRECEGLKPVIDTHDVPDNWQPTGNPVSLSPELQQYVSGWPLKGYDNPDVNKWFADSFRLRNCRICHAVLQVRVRHYNIDTFSNDAIIAGLAPYNTPNKIFLNVALWPGPQMKTYILPANALSQYVATDNPLPTFLDVRIQDDTDVDYARIVVWYY
jgi:hypothetical protein